MLAIRNIFFNFNFQFESLLSHMKMLQLHVRIYVLVSIFIVTFENVIGLRC